MEDNLKEKNDLSKNKSTMNESVEANKVSSPTNSSSNHDGNKNYDQHEIDDNISILTKIKSMTWSAIKWFFGARKK